MFYWVFIPQRRHKRKDPKKIKRKNAAIPHSVSSPFPHSVPSTDTLHFTRTLLQTILTTSVVIAQTQTQIQRILRAHPSSTVRSFEAIMRTSHHPAFICQHNEPASLLHPILSTIPMPPSLVPRSPRIPRQIQRWSTRPHLRLMARWLRAPPHQHRRTRKTRYLLEGSKRHH